MAIFDNFKGQIIKKVVDALEQNNIQSVLIPANCTDRLQPMDIFVNKSIKTFLRKQFTAWYAEQISKQVKHGSETAQAPPPAEKQGNSKNTESISEESDETWRDSSSDDDRDDKDEDSTGSSSESNEDTRAEFKPVDTSAVRMKSL